MTYTAIRLTHSGSVSTITLDRPPVNAASPILLAEVLAALNELEAHHGARCIVFTGEGTKVSRPGRISGADIGGEYRSGR
jgi:enoyl-CoA hydratase/carnithine racemase